MKHDTSCQKKTKRKASTNLVDSKRRHLKAKAKREESLNSPIKSRSVKTSKAFADQATWKTPDVSKIKEELFFTPVKQTFNERPDCLKACHKLKQMLFSEPSETAKDCHSKSERKLTPNSENSCGKASKSALNSSDMKCSEVLNPKKLHFNSEHVDDEQRYLVWFHHLYRELDKENQPNTQWNRSDQNVDLQCLPKRDRTTAQKKFNTPEPVIPNEECLLYPSLNFDHDNCTLKPLNLDFFDEEERSKEDLDGCLQFQMESDEPVDLPVLKEKYPSFQGYESFDYDMGVKLFSQEESFNL